MVKTKILAMILAVAMIVAIVPAFGLVASADIVELDTHFVADRSLYVDKTAIGTDEGEVNLTSDNGTGWGLPRNSDTVSNASNAGGNRGALLAFKVDTAEVTKLHSEAEIVSATLHVKINGTVNNLGSDDNQWVKFGIYPVASTWDESSSYETVNALGFNEEGTGSNTDYILSNEKINQKTVRSTWNGWATYNRWVTFDITEQIKAKAEEADGEIEVSYRIAGPAATGIYTAKAADENKPYISLKVDVPPADVAVKFVNANGDVIGEETVSAAVGSSYTYTNTVNDNYVVIENETDTDGVYGYLAELVESETKVVEEAGTEVTVTVIPKYKLKTNNLLPDGEDIDNWTIGTADESNFDTQTIADAANSQVQKTSDQVHSGSYAVKTTDGWRGHKFHSWRGDGSIVMYSDANPDSMYYFAGAFYPGSNRGTQMTIATLTTANDPRTLQGQTDGSMELSNGGITSWDGSEADGHSDNGTRADNDNDGGKFYANSSGKWNQMEYVLTTDADSAGIAVIMYYLLDCGTSYFDDFMLYEVEEIAVTEESAQAALDGIKLASVAKESVELPEVVYDENGLPVDVAWEADSEVIDAETGAVTAPEDVTVVTLTPSTEVGETPVTGTAKTVTVFPASYKGGTIATETAQYDVVGDSLIENGWFENGTEGWYSRYMADYDTTNYPIVEDGDVKYAQSTNTADSKSIAGYWDITENPADMYLLTYLVYSPVAYTGNGRMQAATLWTATDTNPAPDLAKVGGHSSWSGTHLEGGQAIANRDIDIQQGWVRKAYILDKSSLAEAEKVYATFSTVHGNTGFAITGFELYVLEQAEEELVEVEDIKMTETTVISGNAPALPATTIGTYSLGSKKPIEIVWDLESVDLVTPTKDTPVEVKGSVEGLDKEFTVNVTVLPKSYAWDQLASYGSQSSAKANAITFEDISDTFNVEFDMQINTIADTSVQIGYNKAIFRQGQVALSINKGVLNAAAGDGSGEEVDAVSVTLLDSVKAGDKLRVFYTIKAAEKTYDVTVVTADGTVSSKKGIPYRYNADAINSIIAVTNTSVNNADNNIVLSNIKIFDPNYAEAPELTAALGWDGNDFTVNFLFGKVRSESITIEGEAVAVAADENGVAVDVEGKTNRVYTATASNTSANGENTKQSAEVKASVYNLVAEAIAAVEPTDTLTEAQLAAATDVLNNGGIYLKKSGEAWVLDEYTQKLMTYKDGTITLTANAQAAGLRFESIASETETGNSVDVTVDEEGISLTVNTTQLQSVDAEVIYLEEVEFVFETAESAADEIVSGELDFVEEV